MKAVLERAGNELPTIAIGVWAALRVAGIDVDDDTAANITETVQTVVGFTLWLLVRRNTDGPVTALRTWHAQRDPAAGDNLRAQVDDLRDHDA